MVKARMASASRAALAASGAITGSPRGILSGVRFLALGTIFAALLHDLLYLFQMRVQTLDDFASYYVPARAVIRFPAMNPYDYAELTHLNGVAHYLAGAFYPYIYPPAALVLLRPLAALPYGQASALWSIMLHVCAIGSALLLADAFACAVERKARETSAGRNPTLDGIRVLLRGTGIPVGKWTFPTVPFAACAGVILFAFPTEDTYFFGQINVVVLFLLVLALHAHLYGRPILAGFAVAVAGALKLTPLFVLAFFFARGAWRAVVAGIAFSALFAAAPLLILSPHVYAAFPAALHMVDVRFVPLGQNESFAALLIHALAILGHSGQRSVSLAQGVAEVLGGVIAVATLGWLLLASYRTSGFPRRNPAPHPSSVDLDWLGFALVLTAYLLVTPLIWSHFYVVALPAPLMLGVYPLLRERGAGQGWDRGDQLAPLCASVAIALVSIQLPLGADHAGTAATLKVADLLRSLRAPALVLTWVALGICAISKPRAVPGSGLEPVQMADATGS